MSPKIVFFGNERLATGVTTTAPVLQGLIQAGYDIAALVVSQSDLGKTRKSRPLEIVQVAQAAGIKVLAPKKLKDVKNELAGLGAQAGVLVAYGKIVPEDIIEIFPHGIVNIHPSLLPKHRGSTPIETVILRGEEETGVSLMSLVKEMDAGPVYVQQKVTINGAETKQLLADTLSMLGRDLLIMHLPGILAGQLQPKPQNEKEFTTTKQITKNDGLIDWNKPAGELEREIRAYAGWPRSRTTIAGNEVVITKAHVDYGDGVAATLWLNGKQFGMHTAKNVLVIDALIPNGKKEMPAEAFLAGYRLG
jgi:methionyl-tRNA formyltransferase